MSTRPDTSLTIIPTRATQCMRGVEIPPFLRVVSHYTDTHLYVFSLALALPLIINLKRGHFLNPVYARRVDPSALAFSLSSHRHSYISLLFSSRFIA